MSPEQYSDVMEIKDALAETPQTFGGLAPALQAVLTPALTPDPSFDTDQIEVLRDAWLLISDAQLTALQDHPDMPTHLEISGLLDIHGQRYLGADILTDAVLPTGYLHALLPILAALPVYIKPVADWPTS